MDLFGRDKTTNEREVLNVDQDGRLKLYESGRIQDIYDRQLLIKQRLDSVDLSLLSINAATDKLNLETERSLGNCFVAGYDSKITTDTHDFFTILNPSTSGKKMYVHSFNVNVSDHSSTNIGGYIRVSWFNESDYTAGSTSGMVEANLKVNGGSTAMQVRKNSTITTRYSMMRDSFSLSTDTSMELFQIARNLPEMIEIPAGYGLTYSLQDDTGATLDVDVTINVRWVEK